LRPLWFVLYVNDLPLASEFNSTLFADDTLLMLSDNNLKSLEKKVNEQFKSIDIWLRKLSLNFSKTNYMVIHKNSKMMLLQIFK